MSRLVDNIDFPSEWIRSHLSELGSIFKGKGIAKSEVISKGIPCVRYGEIYTKYHHQFKETISFINQDSANKSQSIVFGDILFAGSGETPEDIGKAIAYTGN